MSFTEVGRFLGSGGQGLLLSRRVLHYAVKAKLCVVPSKQVWVRAVKADARSCHQDMSGVVLSRKVLSCASRQSRVLCMAGGVITGALGPGLSVPRW